MSQAISCPACKRLPSFLKCNAHRVEAMSTTILKRAKAAGFTGTDPLKAEAYLNARPVVIS
jgi:hypothetical protein